MAGRDVAWWVDPGVGLGIAEMGVRSPEPGTAQQARVSVQGIRGFITKSKGEVQTRLRSQGNPRLQSRSKQKAGSGTRKAAEVAKVA